MIGIDLLVLLLFVGSVSGAAAIVEVWLDEREERSRDR